MSAAIPFEAMKPRIDQALGQPLLSRAWTLPQVLDECALALRRMDGPKLSTIAVTSCRRREGRSTVAAAMAIVEHFVYGRSTVFVELDFEAPSVAERLGIDATPGAAEVLRGEASLEDCLHWHGDDLAVLVAGDSKGDGPGRLAGRLPHQLFDQLRLLAEVVVADLPPLGEGGAGDPLPPPGSTVVLVLRAGTTPIAEVRHAMGFLDSEPMVILNEAVSAVPAWLRTVLGG